MVRVWMVAGTGSSWMCVDDVLALLYTLWVSTEKPAGFHPGSGPLPMPLPGEASRAAGATGGSVGAGPPSGEAGDVKGGGNGEGQAVSLWSRPVATARLYCFCSWFLVFWWVGAAVGG